MNGRKFNVDYWYEIYDLIYKFSDEKLIKLIEYIKAL
mgnify:FL=1